MSRTYRPNGERERARRVRQGAAWNQVWSHLPRVDSPGDLVVWPPHLGHKGGWYADVVLDRARRLHDLREQSTSELEAEDAREDTAHQG